MRSIKDTNINIINFLLLSHSFLKMHSNSDLFLMLPIIK